MHRMEKVKGEHFSFLSVILDLADGQFIDFIYIPCSSLMTLLSYFSSLQQSCEVAQVGV